MKKIIFVVCGFIWVYGCVKVISLPEGALDKRDKFPEVISPIYYLDTIRIESPVVVFIDSIAYLIPETFIKEAGDEPIDKRNMIRICTAESDDYKVRDFLGVYGRGKKKIPNSFDRLRALNSFYLDDLIWFSRYYNGYSIFEFEYEPQTFLLVLMADEENVEMVHDVITNVSYSLDYVLAAVPIFRVKDRKKLQQKYW